MLSIPDTLLDASAQFGRSKCSVWVGKAEVLDHVVEFKGMKPLQQQTGCTGMLAEATSRDESVRFLGLVNFFAAFVDHFAKTTALFLEV